MGGILILGYAAICVVVFKLLRVSLNKWSVATAAVAGVVIIGTVLLGMNYNHPFTTDGRLYFYTTPIAPTVQGRVSDVMVTPNVPVKRGDTLFQIGPKTYQFAVDQKKALLAEAEQAVKQLKASYDQASAAVEMARAQFELAQQNYNRQLELFERNVIAQAAFDTAAHNLETSRQALAGAEAAAERALLLYSSEIGGVNTTVARLQAELGSAELDLSNTTVVAPTDGYVTHLFLRPGMVVNASTPTMVFVHSDPNLLSASFTQNTLQRLQVGNEAEIAFDGIPGRIFGGKVTAVVDGIAQGQLQPSGNLLNPEERSKTPGRAMAAIDILDDLSSYQLPGGATAQVAVYSEHWRWVAVIRRIILRMNAWLNYVI
jgi:multidrug resistance efflux pump